MSAHFKALFCALLFFVLSDVTLSCFQCVAVVQIIMGVAYLVAQRAGDCG